MGGGGGFHARTYLVTSDQLVVRESVGLGQRGSDNTISGITLRMLTLTVTLNKSKGPIRTYFNHIRVYVHSEPQSFIHR